MVIAINYLEASVVFSFIFIIINVITPPPDHRRVIIIWKQINLLEVNFFKLMMENVKENSWHFAFRATTSIHYFITIDSIIAIINFTMIKIANLIIKEITITTIKNYFYIVIIKDITSSSKMMNFTFAFNIIDIIN